MSKKRDRAVDSQKSKETPRNACSTCQIETRDGLWFVICAVCGLNGDLDCPVIFSEAVFHTRI